MIMNFYRCAIQFAKIIKDNDKVKEMLEIYKKIKLLKKDSMYYYFFDLIEMKKAYNFYAPNISLQIINQIYNNRDFKLITEETCKTIINNEDIKKFVKISTEINELVNREVLALFDVEEFKRTGNFNYICNQFSENLGYIGFIENLKLLQGKGNELNMYCKEREKLVEPHVKIFPIKNMNSEFLEKVYGLSISKEVIESYERFNLLLYIIEKIIFCEVYDNVVYIKEGDVKIIENNNKFNIEYIKLECNNEKLLLKHFPLIIFDDKYLFPYIQVTNFQKNNFKITYDCFCCNIKKQNSMLDISIIESLDLFN